MIHYDRCAELLSERIHRTITPRELEDLIGSAIIEGMTKSALRAR